MAALGGAAPGAEAVDGQRAAAGPSAPVAAATARLRSGFVHASRLTKMLGAKAAPAAAAPAAAAPAAAADLQDSVRQAEPPAQPPVGLPCPCSRALCSLIPRRVLRRLC